MAHPRDRELARLVDEGTVDEVLSIVSVRTIADTWCRFNSVDHEWDAVDHDVCDEPDWWAVQFLYECVEPDRRQEFLLALVESSLGDDRVLSIIGAGPFEDWLDEFDTDHVDWIERNAAISPSFQQALSSMHLARSLPDDLRIRINRAAGFAEDRWLRDNP